MNRWEKSDLWARNFAPPLDGAVLRVQAFDLSIAQVTNCFTTPIVLMAQNSVPTGYQVLPTGGALLIRNGAPYATGPGNLSLRFSVASGTAILVYTSLILTGTPTTGFDYAVAYNSPAFTMNNVVPTLGGALQFASAGGNPTVTAALPGSVLTVVVYYQVIPMAPFTVGARTPLP